MLLSFPNLFEAVSQNYLRGCLLGCSPHISQFSSVTIYSNFGPQNIKSATVSIFSLSISHEVMGPDAMILVF